MMRRMGMLGVLGAAWALSGCSSAPTRSYTLYTIAPHDTGQTAAKLAIVPSTTSPRVRIDAVHIPPAFDRVEVVTRVGRGELKINDSDHWSASLAQLARQTLSADLAARLPPGSVIAPHLSKPEGALGISVDIQELEVQPGGASLYVSYAIGATPSSAKRGDGSLRTTQGGTTPAATAAALSELLGQLADSIAGAIAAIP